jgi:FAD/FMN-containing dehydrogenase
MNWLYGPAELDFFRGIKRAFDPAGLANPDKILPVAADRPAAPKTGGELAGTFIFPSKSGLSPEARDLVDELRLRAASGARSAVTGLGTRLKAEKIMEGAKPLDLRRLAGKAEIDRENLTARAEAGLPFADFRRQLAEAGFRLDLPELGGSVGGLIASKVCPEIRGLLLGLELVTAEGELLELGGRTVKNVAGYDGVRLLCGSMGAYGVILAATFALAAGAETARPAPAGEDAWDLFEPGLLHRRLKKEFDPRNLLNPWIYGGK